ncbi:MAG: polyamine aminopropyltransferase [Rhodospirillaceae bacterium]
MAKTFAEVLHKGYAQTFEVMGEMLVDEQSAFQHIQIFDTPLNGRVMALDGIVQVTDRDEASYSEMLVHMPVMEIGTAKRVFIIGGGDGAVAEEALKHPSIEVEMCEIDGRVVEACKEHLPHVNNGAFAHPRFTLHLRDAFEFLKESSTKGRFDVIVADRPDPVGPAEVLFQTSFYELVRDALTDQGVVVFQNGTPFYQPSELTDTMSQLRGVFPQSGCYLTVTPTYIGGFMALTWGSKGTRLGSAAPDEIVRRWQAAGVATDYYNPAIHAAALALPEWIRRLVAV